MNQRFIRDWHAKVFCPLPAYSRLMQPIFCRPFQLKTLNPVPLNRGLH